MDVKITVGIWVNSMLTVNGGSDMKQNWALANLKVSYIKLETILSNHGPFPRSSLSWSRLSEQIFRVDKWSLCRG